MPTDLDPEIKLQDPRIELVIMNRQITNKHHRYTQLVGQLVDFNTFSTDSVDKATERCTTPECCNHTFLLLFVLFFCFAFKQGQYRRD